MIMKIRRFGALLALLVTGCASGRSMVPLGEVTSPPDRDVYYVTTTGGEEFDFVTFKSDGSNVTGTVREVQQRLVGHGKDERVESRSQYRDLSLPLRDIARIEVDKSSSNSLVLIAAGAVAIGGALLLFDGNDPAPEDGGGGKPPPDLP